MFGLWVALVALGYLIFRLLAGRWTWRCLIGGCDRPVGADGFLCPKHEAILEMSRRVGKTAVSSSALDRGEASTGRHRTAARSGGDLRLLEPGGTSIPSIREMTQRDRAAATRPGAILRVVRPYDQEENP